MPHPSPLRLTGRPIRVGGVALQSLGGLTFAGRVVHLLRAGDVDVLLTARRRDPSGQPAFVRTARSDVVYACWPEFPLPADTLDALRQVGQALAAKRDALADEPEPWGPARPEPAAVLALLPPPAGVRLDVGPPRARGFAMIYRDAASRVGWSVRVRRADEPGILRWAIDQDGTAADDLTTRSREHVIATVVALGSACGLSAAWAAPEGTPLFLKVPLGAPVDAAVAALEAAAPGTRRVRLSLAVPSECECACVFCSRQARGPEPDPEPVLRRARALADALQPFTQAAAVIGLTLVGNDALRFPALGELLAILARTEPDTFGIVTPGTTLADRDQARLLADSGLAPTLSFTLHGPDAATHDRIAGLAGAFDRLAAARENCRREGLAVRLHHVLVAPTLEALPTTLALAASWCGHVRLVGFTTEPQHHASHLEERGFLAGLIPDPRRVRALLAEHEAALGASVTAVDDVPTCLLPPALRERLEPRGLARVDLPAELPATCRGCRAHGVTCPGPDRGTLAVFGESWLERL